MGPSANDSLLLLGNYHGLPATTAAAEAEGGSASTPLLALQHRLKDTGVNISYAPGLPVVVGDGVWEFGSVPVELSDVSSTFKAPLLELHWGTSAVHRVGLLVRTRIVSQGRH